MAAQTDSGIRVGDLGRGGVVNSASSLDFDGLSTMDIVEASGVRLGFCVAERSG